MTVHWDEQSGECRDKKCIDRGCLPGCLRVFRRGCPGQRTIQWGMQYEGKFGGMVGY